MIAILVLTILFTAAYGAGRTYIVNDVAGIPPDQDYCGTTYGTTLATVIDAADITALRQASIIAGRNQAPNTDRIFIGLTDNGDQGNFRWMDGSTCDSTASRSGVSNECISYWNTGEPNGNSGQEDCTSVWFIDCTSAGQEDCISANDISCAAGYNYYTACNSFNFEIIETPVASTFDAERACLNTFGTNGASPKDVTEFDAAYQLCQQYDQTYGGTDGICCLGGNFFGDSWVYNDGSDSTLIGDTGLKYNDAGLWAADQPNNAEGETIACMDVTGADKGVHDCLGTHGCFAICNKPSQAQAGVGCRNGDGEIEVVSDSIYACPGSIAAGGTYGDDAAALCNDGYEVCEDAIEANHRGLTLAVCTNPAIFTDQNQFFASKETSAGAGSCYSKNDQSYTGITDADDIWGCGNDGINLGACMHTNLLCTAGSTGETVFSYALANCDAGGWLYGGDHTKEALQSQLTDATYGGVLCCKQLFCTSQPGTFNWDKLTTDGIGFTPLVTDVDYSIEISKSTLALDIRVELPYMGEATATEADGDFGVTYVVDFEDYDAYSDAIYDPGTCQNRLERDYYTDDAMNILRPFDQWFGYSLHPVDTGGMADINTMAYPPPGPDWSVSMKDDTCTTVVYEGSFTWNELVECNDGNGGASYVTTEDGVDEITLKGVFYVNVVSPFDASEDRDYYRVYQLLSAPFTIAISKSVSVLGEVGVNVLTMSIIAVYKEKKENDFRLVVLTESQNYLQLTANGQYLFAPKDESGNVGIITEGRITPPADGNTGVGCINNKNFICSQLWEIKANDVDCVGEGIDFSGTYTLEFKATCRSGGPYETYCNGDAAAVPPITGWINDHPALRDNPVQLQAQLTWRDDVCTVKEFEVQFKAAMSFYRSQLYADDVNNPGQPDGEGEFLFEVGVDEIFVKIDTTFASGNPQTLNIFDTTLEEVRICTFPPGTVVDDPDPIALTGGCFDSVNRDGGSDPNNPYFYKIYAIGPPVQSEEEFAEIDTATEPDVLKFKFKLPRRIARDTLYVQAEIEVTLQPGQEVGTRRMLYVFARRARANQIGHFIKNLGVTRVPGDNNKPVYKPEYPQQPQQPQPYVPQVPPQMPATPNTFVINLSSPWVIGIGSLLAVVLGFNIVLMCYMNCNKRQRARISFDRRRRSGYSSVKNMDSDFNESEANAINVVSDQSD